MKQTRKSKTNRKKTTRTKSTRKKSRTRRNKRMMKGGNPQITEGITSYDKIYKYLLELLNRPDFKQIYEKNIKFIKSININNNNFSDAFDFSNNEQFRNFINDLLQWLLFDYNPYIFDTLLTVIYSCFNDPESPESPEFLQDNVDSLQILFNNLQDMIIGKGADVENLKEMIKAMVAEVEKLKEMIKPMVAEDNVEKINEINKKINEKTNEINLLTLILYVLTIPSVTTAVSDFINKNKAVFLKYLEDIKCVLVEITYDKIKNNQVVRNAMTNYFHSFDPSIPYTKLPGLAENIAKCLLGMLNTFARNYIKSKVDELGETISENVVDPVTAKANALGETISKNVLAPVRAKVNALGETISENVLAPVRAKAQLIYSQARDNLPTVFRRLPVPQ